MSSDNVISEQLDEFNKLIIDLENIDDEDQALLLLCALSKTHDYFKETFLYMRESLSQGEVQDALNSKVLNDTFDVKTSNSKDDLVTKGRSSNHAKLGEGLNGDLSLRFMIGR